MQRSLPLSSPVSWCLLGAAALFTALALLFLLLPAQGAMLFGVDAADRTAHAYVRAVGLRDLALAGYLLLLTLFASARAVLILLLVTLVIPAGDLLLVAAQPGPLRAQLLLHLASAALFGGLALWVARTGGRQT